MADSGDWTVAALLRSGSTTGVDRVDAIADALPGVDLVAVLSAVGIELTVRGTDKLMVRVDVDGTSAEEAEAKVEQRLQTIPCLEGFAVASIRARAA